MTEKEKLEKLKKLADAMYYAAQHLTTDASRLHKAMGEYHKFVTHEYIEEELVSKNIEAEFLRAAHNLRERPLLSDWFRHFYLMGRQHTEPTSDDLEQAIDTYLATYFDGEKEKQDWPFLKKMAIHFAEWKKQKDSIPVSEDMEKAAKENAKIERSDDTEVGYDINRFSGFVDGANWQKEQLIKIAVEIPIVIADGEPAVAFALPNTGLKKGDKIKVIAFKK